MSEFTEDHARKVAEKLFPYDIPMDPTECVTDCRACAVKADKWKTLVEEVLKALQMLEE